MFAQVLDTVMSSSDTLRKDLLVPTTRCSLDQQKLVEDNETQAHISTKSRQP